MAAKAVFGCGALLLFGCSAPHSERVTSDEAAIVYGNDDRKEVFEGSELERRLALSTVALVRRSALDESGVGPTAPSLATRNQLCAGERFAEQPSIAFCSGVLVEADLVLTAAHCAQALPLSQLAVVFGYFYIEPNTLAMTPGDVAFATQVVAERSRLASGGAELDVAWLRLDRKVSAWPPLEAIRREPLANEAPLVVVSATAGVPLKIDPGATVSQARSAENDSFVADSDTFHGSSGAGAFDENGALVGILSRGKEDFASTDAGCNLTLHEPTSAAAERYSYAAQAVASLCASDESNSALCELSCPEPCASAARFIAAGGGCFVQPGRTRPGGVVLLVNASLIAIALRRRRIRRGESRRRQRNTFGAALHSRLRRIK